MISGSHRLPLHTKHILKTPLQTFLTSCTQSNRQATRRESIQRVRLVRLESNQACARSQLHHGEPVPSCTPCFLLDYDICVVSAFSWVIIEYFTSPQSQYQGRCHTVMMRHLEPKGPETESQASFLWRKRITLNPSVPETREPRSQIPCSLSAQRSCSRKSWNKLLPRAFTFASTATFPSITN